MRNFLKFFAAIAAATILTACGGGGGGGEGPAGGPSGAIQPPVIVADTTKPELQLVTSSPAALTTTVVFSANEDLGGNVAIVVKDASGVTVAGSTSLQQGNRGMTWTPSAALVCNAVYTASASGTDLAGNVGTVTGTVTTVACPPTKLRYTDKVVAIWTDGYPFLVTKTGATPVINQTSYQSGAIPLGSCGLPQPYRLLENGEIPIECRAAADLKRHILKLNPVTGIGILSNYTGTVVSDTTFVLSESNSVQPVANTTACRVSDGWYYAEPGKAWRLLFQADAGGAPVLVKEGKTAMDTVRVIRCYDFTL